MKFLAGLLFLIASTLSLGAADLKNVSLQLQWKYQFQFAGYIMAKEKGFYRDAGLNVDIKEWRHPLKNVDELMNNRVEYAILRPTALIDIAQGKELVFLAAIYQSSPLVLLADISSNIATLEDFKDKRLMATGDLHSDSALLSMMFSQGLKIEDVEIVEPSFNVLDLLNKKTDLIASYISNEPFVLREHGGTPVIFDPKDYGYDFYNDFVSVSKEYMDANPQEVKKFREATLKGWEYAFANIQETVDTLHENYNTQNKSKNALAYEGEELKKLAYVGTAKIGIIQKEKLAKIYDVYKLLGMAKKEINYNKVIYNSVSNEVELSEEEKEYLERKEKIRVCIDPHWTPFEKFDKNGQHAGVSADYYKLFEQFISTPFETVSTQTWSESIKLAQNRECDILSLAMQTPQRKKYLDFTTPYLSVPVVVATKANHEFIPAIDYLRGEKLGIRKKGPFVEILKNKYPFLDLVEIESLDEGLQKVNSGELDGFIGALASISFLLQEEYGAELKIAGKIDETMELGIGVRNDDATLLSILQKAVNNVKEEQRREILNNWISVKYEQGFDYELFWKLFGLAFFIFALLLYFNYKSNQYIKLLEEKQRELEQITITDGLTNIYNRRYFNEMLPKVINGAKRNNSLVCFLLLDIDYFKSYNDNYGHQEGDEILIRLSSALKESLKRADDMAFRLGGEEFGIIYKSDTKEQALEFANSIREKIENLKIEHNYSKVSKYVTASIGLACKHGNSVKDMNQIYKEADDLLYKAKESGKNRVCN